MANSHTGTVKMIDGIQHLTCSGIPRKGDSLQVDTLNYLVTGVGDGYITAKASLDGFEERTYNYSYDLVMKVVK